jgi:hypothetical protein
MPAPTIVQPGWCDANGVVTVALVDLHLQSRFRMPGIDADNRTPHFIQLGPQPCRCCSSFEPDPRDMRGVQPDKRGDRLWVGGNHGLALNLARPINDADRCHLQ